MTVSYTHLDVYKRQILCRPEPVFCTYYSLEIKEVAMNSISNIKRLILSNSLTYKKKIELKHLGPPKPNLDVTQQNQKNG